MRRKRKNVLNNILIALCVIVLIVCLALAARTIWSQLHPELEYRDMSAKYTEEVEAPEEPVAEPEEDPNLYRVIDFASLQALNPEIVGWIYIPDTPIDYPICRNVDDENYYLTHGSEKQETVNGAIFITPETDFTDTSLIIYGHNMRAGIMFGMLKHYAEDDYLLEHPYIYIYTPEVSYRTEVFCSEEVDAEGDTYLTGWSKGTVSYGEWLSTNFPVREAAGLSHEITMYDQIYILSTCVGSNAYHRYIVASVPRASYHPDTGIVDEIVGTDEEEAYED